MQGESQSAQSRLNDEVLISEDGHGQKKSLLTIILICILVGVAVMLAGILAYQSLSS